MAPEPIEFNLADLFERVVDTAPDRLALVAGDRRLTYAQLDERANRVGHALLDGGARAGQHVGIHAHNRAEWVEAMLGCFKARLVPVNVNYRYVVEELRYLFDNADLVALLFESQFSSRIAPVLPDLTQLHQLIRIEDGTEGEEPELASSDYEATLAAASPERNFGHRSPDDRYILYTGGTTGMPKGVIWRQEDIFFAAMGGGNYGGPGIERPELIAQSVSATPAVTLALAPLMHGNAQWTMFNTIFGGGTVVLSTDRRFDPDAIWKLIDAEKINTVSLVGDAMARPLVDALAARSAPASLFAIVSGGAILSPTIKTQMHELMPDGARARLVRCLGDGRQRGRRELGVGDEVPHAGIDHRGRRPAPAGPRRVRPGGWPAVVTCRSVTTRTRRRRRRRSSRSTATAGRFPATWRCSSSTARSPSSGAGRRASTRAARRSSPKRSNRR